MSETILRDHRANLSRTPSDQSRTVPPLPDPVGDGKRRSVIAGQELVRLGIADERFGSGVEGQLPAQAISQAVQGDAVFLEVFRGGQCQRLVNVLVVTEGLGVLVERNIGPQTVGDVGQVAECCGIVTLENVGVQLVGLPAANGRDEIAEMPLARPSLRLDLDAQAGKRLTLVGSLAVELVVDDRAFLEVGEIADLLALKGTIGRPRTSKMSSVSPNSITDTWVLAVCPWSL